MAKARALAAQKMRLAVRVLELRAAPPPTPTRRTVCRLRLPSHRAAATRTAAKDGWVQCTPTTRSRAYYRGQLLEDAFQREKGHRTYYTFKGKAAAVKEAVRLTLAPYTWAGPNPYSPRTDEEEELEDGRLWMVVSRCTNS